MSPSWGGFILPNGSFRQYDVVFLECSAGGGQAPYTWQWSFGDGTNATATGVETPWDTENHSYDRVGTYTVVCNGTDSLGAHGSATMTIRVTTWPLIIVDLVIQPQGSVLQGNLVFLTADTYWGYGPVNYSWSGLPPGCSAPAAAEAYRILCAPTAGGVYNISVTVTDAVTHHVSRSYGVLAITPAFLGMPEPQAYWIVALVFLLAVTSEIVVRLARVVPPRSGGERSVASWGLPIAGGALGLASFLLPWMYLGTSGLPSGNPLATFRPIDVFMDNPSVGVPASRLAGIPFYPNSLWFALAPQIVGYLVFGAGCALVLLRRMQGSLIMLLGLAVAYWATPQDYGTMGVGAGWYVGLLAAFLALGGTYLWWPPRALAPSSTPSSESPAPPEPISGSPPQQGEDDADRRETSPDVTGGRGLARGPPPPKD